MSWVTLILAFFKQGFTAYVKWEGGRKQRRKEAIWNALKKLESEYSIALSRGDAINASIVAKRMSTLRQKYKSLA